MKQSFYNLLFDYPNEFQSVLYNSLYGSLILLEQYERGDVEGILNNPNQDYTDNKFYSILCKEKFLVPIETNEIEIIKNRKKQGINDSNRLDVVLMPTLNCNFACSYCYENHLISSMDYKTENSLIKWLEKEIPLYKFVLIHWYGGEPLLEINKIINISTHIKSIADNFNVELSIHITSNGFLFTKSIIKQLINCNILDYQITVDGTEEYHNTLRPLKNGNPTFNRIFKNIIDLAEFNDEVKVSLRVNFNHYNFESIPSLLQEFPSNIRKQLRILFEPIFGDCSISAVDNITNLEISDKLASYYKLAEKLGYDVILGLSHLYIGKLVYCYAERKNQYIINYNGDVFKCSVDRFLRNDRVGYISEQGEFIKENDNYSKWVSKDLFDKKCYECKYLPLCMGGCRKMRIQNNNTGSVCDLVPTNTSYILKQIAFNGLSNLIKKEIL